MQKFTVNNIEFQITGTRFFEYLCEGYKEPKKIWYVDLKNLSNNKHKLNVNYDKIKQYL